MFKRYFFLTLTAATISQVSWATTIDSSLCDRPMVLKYMVKGTYLITFKPEARLQNLDSNKPRESMRKQKAFINKVLKRYLRNNNFKSQRACKDIDQIEQEITEIRKEYTSEEKTQYYEKALEKFDQKESADIINSDTSMEYYIDYGDQGDDEGGITKEDCLKAVDFMQRLEKHPLIEFVQPEIVAHIEVTTPNDPLLNPRLNVWNRSYSPSWALDGLEADAAWTYTRGKGITIAVVDSGISYHPDLTTNLLNGYDFYNRDSSPKDDHGHGTFVAGILGATANNNKGLVGLAYESKILPIKVFNQKGKIPKHRGCNLITEAIDYALENNADIINCSFSVIHHRDIEAAFANASSRSIIIVAAAGNEGSSLPTYPANYPNIISTTSIDHRGTISSFSNYGSWVDFAAPGESVVSTSRNSKLARKIGELVVRENKDYGYWTNNGTSFAAPYVTALIALMLSYDPSLTAEEIKSKITDSSSTSISSAIYDIPIINAGDTLSAMFNNKAQSIIENDNNNFLDYDEKVDYALAINSALINNISNFDVNADKTTNGDDDDLLNAYLYLQGPSDLSQINEYRKILSYIDTNQDGKISFFENLSATGIANERPFITDLNSDGIVNNSEHNALETILQYVNIDDSTIPLARQSSDAEISTNVDH